MANIRNWLAGLNPQFPTQSLSLYWVPYFFVSSIRSGTDGRRRRVRFFYFGWRLAPILQGRRTRRRRMIKRVKLKGQLTPGRSDLQNARPSTSEDLSANRLGAYGVRIKVSGSADAAAHARP